MFQDMEKPDFMKINWTEAKEGKGLRFSRKDLGIGGKKFIERTAKQHGVFLEILEEDDDIAFFVIAIDEKYNDQSIDEILSAISDGITWTEMQKKEPFSKLRPKDLRNILLYMKAKNLITDELYIGPSGGRPTILWRKK
jgi:hypothetical protein